MWWTEMNITSLYVKYRFTLSSYNNNLIQMSAAKIVHIKIEMRVKCCFKAFCFKEPVNRCNWAGRPTICCNNIDLEVKHNVSPPAALSRWEPEWMTEQNGGKLKNGGYHEVTDRMTSAVRFQRALWEQPVCEGNNVSVMEKHQGVVCSRSQTSVQVGAELGGLLRAFCVCFCPKNGLNVWLLLHNASTICFVLVFCVKEML